MIESKDMIYNLFKNLGGIQTNTIDESMNSEIMRICENITKELILLNDKLDCIDEVNNKNMKL